MAKAKGKPARKLARKPARKAAAKPASVRRAKPTRAAKAPAKRSPASRARPETAGWTAKKARPVRRNADIPEACPICGSKDLEVRKADGVAKGAAKVAASVAVPFLVVRFHPEVDCRSCGWRSEAT